MSASDIDSTLNKTLEVRSRANQIVPDYLKIVYSEDLISAEIKRLGLEVSAWASEVFQSTGQDLISIPVLRGGLYFFADLSRKIELSVEVAPLRAMAYLADVSGVKQSEVSIMAEDLNVKGRSVLIVDDICDSGDTLEKLVVFLKQQGASQVRSAVLIQKVVEKQLAKPDYVGFVYEGPEWFVGYGMDDGSRYRNLADVFVMTPV